MKKSLLILSCLLGIFLIGSVSANLWTEKLTEGWTFNHTANGVLSKSNFSGISTYMPGVVNDSFQAFGGNKQANNVLTGNFSISLWVNSTPNNNNNSYIFTESSGNDLIRIWFDFETRIAFQINGAGSWIPINGTATSTNRWYHIVAQRNSSTAELWIDGILIQSKVSNETAGYSSNIRLTSSTNPAFPRTFNGGIDELYIFNQTLTVDEIALLYANGTYTSNTAPLVYLNSPINNLNFSTNSVTFNCSATDETGVINLTLLINGADNVTVLNSTFNENLSLQQTLTLNQGTNTWNCRASDKTITSLNSTRNIFIDSVYPLINILFPINKAYNYLISFLNWSYIELNPAKCWVYNGSANNTVTCGLNVTANLSSINGVNNWAIYINDTAGNVNSSLITFYITSLSNNLTHPFVNQNFTTSYLNFSISAIPTSVNLTNSTIYLWNSSGSLINSTLNSLTGNYTNYTNFTISGLNFGIYTWTNEVCGISSDDINSNFCNTPNNQTFNIVNDSIKIFDFNLSSDFQFGTSNYLIANVSNGFGTSYKCNFTAKYPNGTAILNNSQGTTNGNYSYSSTFNVVLSGQWIFNVSCYNDYGTLSNVQFNSTNNYLFLRQPEDFFLLVAVNNKTELNHQDFALYDTVNTSINFNITATIEQSDNFTISLSTYYILLNSSDNSTNPVEFIFYVNATDTITNGTYRGNITFTNTTLGLSYITYFAYGISPPSAELQILNAVTEEKCTNLDNSSCYNEQVVNQGSSVSKSYKVKNTGYYNAKNCTPFFDNQLSASWITFDSTHFDLAINETKNILVTFSPTSSITLSPPNYVGWFNLYCDKANLLDHNTTSKNNPKSIITVTTPSIIVPPAGGGGGGSSSQVNVVALSPPVTYNKTLTNLSLAILYARINEFCKNFSISTSTCDMPKTNKDSLVSELKKQGIDITYEELITWIDKFNDNDIFSFRIEESTAKKYNLFQSTVKAGVIQFEINPARIDSYFLILNKDSKFTFISTANKVIDSIEIISGGENFEITKKDTSSVLTYTPKDLNFNSKVITGRISYTSSSGEVFFQDVQIRAIYVFSSTFVVSSSSVVLLGILLVVFRVRVLKSIKSIKEKFIR